MFKKITAVAISLAVAVGLLVGCGGTATDNGEIKLGKYKGIVVYEDDVEVKDSDYKQTVDGMLQQDTKTEVDKSGKVKKDSIVTADYSGKIEVDGKKVKFDGGTAKDQSINMATDGANYIDGFTDALLGHKKGDKFTKQLKFPKSYQQSTKVAKKDVKLAGKDVWFTYKVKKVEKSVQPKLTDKYVQEKYGAVGVKTVKEFKDYAYKQMRIQNIMNKVWQKFVDSCEVVKYDEKKLKEAESEAESQFEAQLQQQYGADIDTYLEACSMSQKDWKKQVNTQAKDMLKEKMIINAIAEKEGLKLSEADYKKEAETLAEQQSAKLSELESQYGKDEIEFAILYQKVQEFIVDNVKEKKGSEPTTTPAPTKAAKKEETKAAEKKNK